METAKNKTSDAACDPNVGSLVRRRWLGLLLLFLVSFAIGICLCLPLATVRERVSEYLFPWGWIGGPVVGLAAATGMWVVLRALGVNQHYVITARGWTTNPPA